MNADEEGDADREDEAVAVCGAGVVVFDVVGCGTWLGLTVEGVGGGDEGIMLLSLYSSFAFVSKLRLSLVLRRLTLRLDFFGSSRCVQSHDTPVGSITSFGREGRRRLASISILPFLLDIATSHGSASASAVLTHSSFG